MRVLVTNDDGIDSYGLTVLAHIAAKAGADVIVAAPHRQYSGASASLTSHEEDGRLALVSARPPGLAPQIASHAVKAAPALISFVAAFGAFGPRPDFVLSGVNLGANTGHATVHSGTVGAALSATTQGIPAMAVSIASGTPQHWQTAEAVARHAFEWLREEAPTDRVLNINVPDVPNDQLRGLRSARLASFGAVQARVRQAAKNYVTLTYASVDPQEEPGSDHDLLTRGWATATLLSATYDDPEGMVLPQFERAQAGPVEVDVSSGTVMSTDRGAPAGEITGEEVDDDDLPDHSVRKAELEEEPRAR